PGMTFWRMPLLVWANFATSTLVVLATPFIAGSQFFILFDRVMHTNFFRSARNDLLAYAAARLGELRDVNARRPRDAVHRRLAVLHPLRPGHAHELLPICPE